MQETFGSEVRRLRKLAGLSQDALSSKLGISREAVSQIERGHTKRPENSTLEGLEQHIGLNRLRAPQLIGEILDPTQSDPKKLIQQIAALHHSIAAHTPATFQECPGWLRIDGPSL